MQPPGILQMPFWSSTPLQWRHPKGQDEIVTSECFGFLVFDKVVSCLTGVDLFAMEYDALNTAEKAAPWILAGRPVSFQGCILMTKDRKMMFQCR